MKQVQPIHVHPTPEPEEPPIQQTPRESQNEETAIHLSTHSNERYTRKRANSDPKAKLLTTLVVAVSLSLSITYFQLCCFAILIGVIGKAHHSSLKEACNKVLMVVPLVVSLGILTYFSTTEPVELQWNTVHQSYSAGNLSLFYMCRTFLLVFQVIIILQSEDMFDIVLVLHRFKVPKVLTLILLFMARTLLDLREEAKRMKDAMYSRLGSSRLKSKLSSYKLLGYMIGGLLYRTLLRMKQRKEALISRGYQGEISKLMKDYPLTFHGFLWLWIATIGSLLLLIYPNPFFIAS